MGATMVPQTCDYCGVSFLRALGLVNRNRKLGMGTYCSLSHAKLANPSANLDTLRPMSERLWRKVTTGDGCWEFTGSKNTYGYGIMVETVDGQRHERLSASCLVGDCERPDPGWPRRLPPLR